MNPTLKRISHKKKILTHLKINQPIISKIQTQYNGPFKNKWALKIKSLSPSKNKK